MRRSAHRGRGSASQGDRCRHDRRHRQPRHLAHRLEDLRAAAFEGVEPQDALSISWPGLSGVFAEGSTNCAAWPGHSDAHLPCAAMAGEIGSLAGKVSCSASSSSHSWWSLSRGIAAGFGVASSAVAAGPARPGLATAASRFRIVLSLKIVDSRAGRGAQHRGGPTTDRIDLHVDAVFDAHVVAIGRVLDSARRPRHRGATRVPAPGAGAEGGQDQQTTSDGNVLPQ